MARSSAAVPICVGIALVLSVLIAFAALLATVSAEEATEHATGKNSAYAEAKSEGEPVVEELPDDATLLKMKVRELKGILAKKGPEAECLACTSKQEYVDRIRVTADWPNVAKQEEPDTPSMEELQKMFSNSKERAAELKKRLKDAGVDISNIFTGDQLNSEELEKEFKKWAPADGAAKDSAAKEDSHVDL